MNKLLAETWVNFQSTSQKGREKGRVRGRERERERERRGELEREREREIPRESYWLLKLNVSRTAARNACWDTAECR